jgi:hypothetical protein
MHGNKIERWLFIAQSWPNLGLTVTVNNYPSSEIIGSIVLIGCSCGLMDPSTSTQMNRINV